MEFESFLSLISQVDHGKLKGFQSHKKMIPKERNIFPQKRILELNPKRAAVLALFYPDINNETKFLLTLRANYKGTHASQISFPGGKYDISDHNLKNTALRETFEEVGIEQNRISILKQMSDTFIPPSNFLVSPFIGVHKGMPIFNPNHEVEALIEVKLSDLLDDKSIATKNLSTSYMKNIDVPCYLLNDYIVWGATAMILSEIKDLLKSI